MFFFILSFRYDFRNDFCRFPYLLNDKISSTKTGNKKAVPESTAFKVLTFMRSALGNSSDRACSSASTAGNTNISIDVVLCITLRDSANRAAISA